MTNGRVIIIAKKKPISTARSANWNGDVVAISTPLILKKEMKCLSMKAEEKNPPTNTIQNIIVDQYIRWRRSSKYGRNVSKCLTKGFKEFSCYSDIIKILPPPPPSTTSGISDSKN